MRVWTWIDGFFDTPAKRRKLLLTAVGFFWIWQCVWICMLSWRLVSVADIEGLLTLQAGLDAFAQSWLNRIVLGIVQAGGFSWGLLGASTHMQDVVALLLSVVALCASRKGKWAATVFFVLVCFALSILILGFSAGSLWQVITLLHVLGWMGLAVCASLSMVVLYWIAGFLF